MAEIVGNVNTKSLQAATERLQRRARQEAKRAEENKREGGYGIRAADLKSDKIACRKAGREAKAFRECSLNPLSIALQGVELAD